MKLTPKGNISWPKLVGGFLISETARVRRKINNKNYKEAIMSVKSIIPEFLYKLYNPNFKIRENKRILKEDLERSIEYIVNSRVIPFSHEELYEILNEINIKECKVNELEHVAEKVYNILYNFSQKILIELL